MNLLEIIITSLKIFAFVSVVIVAISYLFYKAKGRSKTFNTDELIRQQVAQPSYESLAPVVIQKKYDEEVLSPAKIAMPTARFKVLNNNSVNLNLQNGYRPQPILTSKFSNRKFEEETNFNIYSYYSDNDVTPMHKLKFSSMRNNNFR